MDKITGKPLDIIAYLMGDNADKQAIYDLTLHQDVKKRSLDSNAYFHKLCTLLAQAQTPPISMIRCKNMMIADYGQPEYIGDELVIIKSNLPPEKMCDLEYLHTSCVRILEEKGKNVYFYKVYRGTHTYNTKEFWKLLQGTIQECKQVGIQTATPDELEHMQALWEMNYKKRSKGNEPIPD